jgi:hypothetical protein
VGPRVVDTGNPVFFSPNQSAQNVAVSALTQGASRSFYLALMPNFYGIHYWPRLPAYWTDRYGVTRAPTPDMGVKTIQSCYVFYLPHDTYTMLPYQGMWSWASGQEFTRSSSYSFGYTAGGAAWSLISGETVRAGQNDTRTSLIDPVLAERLFSPNGLNLPLMQFTSKGGPMRGQWVDASLNMPQRHPNKNICSGSDSFLYPKGDQAVNFVPEEIDPPSSLEAPVGADEFLDTVTTLKAPAAVLSGQDLRLSATVLAGAQPVTGGQVSFRLDDAEIALVPIDAAGSASLAVPDLSVGEHEVAASYARVDPYETSMSATAMVEVTVPTEDLGVSLSKPTLQLRRGAISEPLTVSALSLHGLSGTAQFQCIGLPAGMTCSFSPSQAPLAENGTATASLVIASSQSAGAGAFFLLLLPLALGYLRATRLVLIAVVTGLVAMTACSGGGNTYVTQQVETATFQIAVTVGPVARSATVTVNLQP